LQLVDTAGETISAYFNSTTKWPCGSIKWVQLYFQASEETASSDQLFISTKNKRGPGNFDQVQQNGIHIESINENIIVNTSSAIFRIRKQDLAPFDQVLVTGINQLSDHGSRSYLDNTDLTLSSLEQVNNPIATTSLSYAADTTR